MPTYSVYADRHPRAERIGTQTMYLSFEEALVRADERRRQGYRYVTVYHPTRGMLYLHDLDAGIRERSLGKSAATT
jgi:uncharacterized membrane protein (UPF0127 family)